MGDENGTTPERACPDCDGDLRSWVFTHPEAAMREIERLRQDCFEAYQAAGSMANALGWWDMPEDHPWSRPIEKLLDNLSAAAGGEPRKHDDLLPFALMEVESTDAKS